MVELLLGSGANPDLQDKVSAEQNSGVHVNLSNERWYVLHPVKPGAIVNFPPICLYRNRVFLRSKIIACVSSSVFK